MKKFLITIIGIFLISSLTVMTSQYASASHATVDMFAEFHHFSNPALIVVTDPTLVGAGSVEIFATTNADPSGITLTLTETSPGIFTDFDPSVQYGYLSYMNGDNKFELGTTIELTYEDVSNNNIGVTDSQLAFSSSDGGNVAIFDLVETVDDTGIFKGHLTFVPPGSSGNNVLEITPGERFAIGAACSEIVHGQITPIPENNIYGAIRADRNGDTITVTYGDSFHTDSAIISAETSGGCGGSGGGLVINKVILDVLAGGASGGTSGGDFIPPQITISKLNLSNLPLVSDILNFITNADPFTPITPLHEPSIDYPLSINGNGYLLTQFANTIETYEGKTGEPISLKMTLFDSTGVEHIGLYTNLRGDHREISDSDTYLIYHEGKPLEITDPNGFFSNVNFTESEYNGKYIANFDMTFARPMDTSDIIIRTWDELLNSGDIKIFDAIKIDGEPILPDTNDLIVPDSADIVIPYYKTPFYDIPNADPNGNLVYYNSFGGLEERQTHPQSTPIVYPNYIGKDERHDDGFNDNTNDEEIRAQTLVQSLTGDPLALADDIKKDVKFYYPSNVGKLDRENKDILQNLMIQENLKASKVFNKKYHTNHILD